MEDPKYKSADTPLHTDNEFDDFTQKLLDKKVEIALFSDDEEITSSQLEGTMSEVQRRTAETSMLNALDQLRKERGQTTIEEEEASFRKAHPEAYDQTSDAQQNSEQDAEEYLFTDPNRYETRHREDHFVRQEQRPSKPPVWKKPKFWILMAALAILLSMFGAYYWKVAVFDPAHVADSSQTEAYNRLVNFADEYSMMSDSQKKDITKLENDFNSLPEAKKTEINDYFQNPKHTGRTFEDLLAEAKQNSLLAANPGLQELLNYAGSYAGLDQAGKDDIVNRLDAYNALNDEAKAQVDAAMNAAAQMDFMTAYNQTRQALDAAAAQQQSEQNAADQAADQQAQAENEQNAALISQYQQQLNSLYSDRDNYAYFLSAEGLPEDDILAQYDLEISQLEAQLAALQ